MASRKNGSGDELYILFNASGAIMKGFDHESAMSPWARDDQSLWPQLFDNVPPVFEQFLKEPSFEISDTTFCIWRQRNDPSWSVGKIAYPDGDESSDGSEEQLSLLCGGPELYVKFAKDYFEKDVSLEVLTAIYDHAPITENLVRKLNPETSLEALTSELLEIGYVSVAGSASS